MPDALVQERTVRATCHTCKVLLTAFPPRKVNKTECNTHNTEQSREKEARDITKTLCRSNAYEDDSVLGVTLKHHPELWHLRTCKARLSFSGNRNIPSGLTGILWFHFKELRSSKV